MVTVDTRTTYTWGSAMMPRKSIIREGRLMTARKKRGIGTMILGVVTVGIGVTLMVSTQTPAWVNVGLTIIGTIGQIFGFAWVFPDAD